MMKSIYEAQVAAKVDVPVSASVKECRKVCKAGSWPKLGILLGAQREALEGCGGPLEGSGTALGRLLAGSWRLPRGILDQRPS